MQTAITSEQAHPVDGDIIAIPSGTCTWLSAINQTFSNSVTIQGAGAVSATTGGASTTGTDLTIIIDNTGGNGDFNITTVAGKSLRITGIDFATNSSSAPEGTGMLIIGGQSSAVRVDHCHIDMSAAASKGIGLTGGVIGVADHLYIVSPSNSTTNPFAFLNGGNWQGDSDPNSLGDKSWVDTDHFGTNQFFYVEDSRWLYGYMSDCSNGGRWAVRYSTVLSNNGAANHGTHDPWRGCRAVEVYKSTFNVTPLSEGGGVTHLNSGTTMIWGNTVTSYGHVIDLNNVRQDGSTYSQSQPPNGWGYCNATTGSVWDGNSGPGGYPCLDQAARGAGDLLAGYPMSSILNVTAGNIRTWPHQALVPVYAWANTLSGAGSISIVGDNTGGLLADNRDYFQQFGSNGEPGTFNGTAGVGQGSLPPTNSSAYTNAPNCRNSTYPGPGYWDTTNNTLYVCTALNTWTAYYTPYTYPHPLTQSSVGTVAPPTNLSAIVN